MTQTRKAKIEDAAGLVALYEKLDAETKFMLFAPGERVNSIAQQTERLKIFADSSTSAMFVAESEGTILGFAVCIGGLANRNRHSAALVVGVVQNAWNQGLGRELLKNLEEWAIQKNLHRLELTVMAHNARAIALYNKCGFEQEGIKRDAVCVDGSYLDELYMAKLL